MAFDLRALIETVAERISSSGGYQSSKAANASITNAKSGAAGAPSEVCYVERG